jgi:hypothetical protein
MTPLPTRRVEGLAERETLEGLVVSGEGAPSVIRWPGRASARDRDERPPPRRRSVAHPPRPHETSRHVSSSDASPAYRRAALSARRAVLPPAIFGARLDTSSTAPGGPGPASFCPSTLGRPPTMRLRAAAIAFALLSPAGCDKKDDAPAQPTASAQSLASAQSPQEANRHHEREGDGGGHEHGDRQPK